MKLEYQVASLELCKRLKELGVRRESAFYWCCAEQKDNRWVLLGSGREYYEKGGSWSVDDFFPESRCAAFNVAELGEMLPHHIGYELGPDFYCEKVAIGWKVYYWSIAKSKWDGVEFLADTEANARAKMLIYLIEQGIVKLKKDGE